jgi:hypothetical protein
MQRAPPTPQHQTTTLSSDEATAKKPITGAAT